MNLPLAKYRHRGTPTMGGLKYNVILGKNKNGEFIMRVTNSGVYGVLLLMHRAKRGGVNPNDLLESNESSLQGSPQD